MWNKRRCQLRSERYLTARRTRSASVKRSGKMLVKVENITFTIQSLTIAIWNDCRYGTDITKCLLHTSYWDFMWTIAKFILTLYFWSQIYSTMVSSHTSTLAIPFGSERDTPKLLKKINKFSFIYFLQSLLNGIDITIKIKGVHNKHL